MSKIAPLGPAEAGQEQSRVLGGDTGPSILYASHILDTCVDKEIIWEYYWLFKGSDGVPFGCRRVRLPP